MGNDWVVRRLGDVAAIVGGTTPSTTEAKYWGGDIPWVTPTDITAIPSGVMYLHSTHRTITEAALQDTSLTLLPPNAVLLTTRATIGNAVLAAVPLTTNQGFCSLIPDASVDSLFLAYWLRGNEPLLRLLSAGSTFPELNRSALRVIELRLPPLAEQKKIAQILSSVDEAIEATQAVIDQTRRVKEAMLQTLLTRGLGHTRFKQTEIGEIPEAWEVRRLGELVTLHNGRAYAQHEMLSAGPWKLIRIQNLKGGDSWYYSNMNLPAHQYCHPGDLLFAWSASFGPFWWRDEKAIYHYHIWRVDCGERLQQAFAYSLLELISQTIRRSAQGGLGMLHMTKSGMEQMQVAVPPLAEQVRIETYLSSVRSFEQAQTGKLKQLHALKSALLQTLLSGQTRVTP